ncbi:MAG: hypothetical protein R6V53_03650 [Candidatus Woesearchaeota archaeon]
MKFWDLLEKAKIEEFDNRIRLPSGRASMTHGDDYLDINIVVDNIDRDLMERLYKEKKAERKIDVVFTLDDFMVADLPFRYASCIESGVTSDVFIPQKQDNPLGLIAKEKLRLLYTKDRVELLGSEAYSGAMGKIASELGLENRKVRFSRSDYDTIREWFDADNQILGLSPEEFHVAEGLCGPMGLKNNWRGDSHIMGFYSDSSDLLNRFRTGACMLEEVRPDERYCRASVDEPMVENWLGDLMKQALENPRLMDRVYSVGRVFGVKKDQSEFDVSDMAREYVNYLSLCRFRTRRDGVKYSSQDLPDFPAIGDVKYLEAVQRDEEQVRNCFYISRKNQYHVTLRVSKSDPTLLDAQQEILDHLGVSFY